MRQDLVAAGHHGDPYAELGVGVAELGAGDAGTHDDEVLGQFGRGRRADASSGFARRRVRRRAARAGLRRWRSARRRPSSSPTLPSGVVTLTRCWAMPGTSSTSSPRPSIECHALAAAVARRCRPTGTAASVLTRLLICSAARSWRPRLRCRTRGRGARRSSVRTPVEAMNVLDGTQSKSTHAPPRPSRVDDGDLRRLRGPRAAATSAAS